MQTLVFEPLIPTALWAALAIGGALLLVVYGRSSFGRLKRVRWLAMMLLMAVALAVPLGILLNPIWTERIPPPAGKPLITIAIDATASMAHSDAPGGKSRFSEAAHIASTVTSKLSGHYEIQLRTFDATTKPIEAAELAKRQPTGETTDLAAAVAECTKEDRPQGQALVLLSDGIHNAGGGAPRVLEAAQKARAMAVPVYTKTLGGEAAVRDLAVELASPQELSFVGQKLPVRVLLESSGLSGQQATVALFDDQEKQLDRKTATLAADKPVEVQFDVTRDKAGVFRYEVRAEPLAGEVTTANNNVAFLLRVVDEPIRVLLLEGKPYWDTKFLLRTLATDRSIELVSVVRLAEARFLERTLGRPVGQAFQPDSTATDASASKTRSDAEPTKSDKTDIAAPDAPKARPEQWKILTSAGQVLADPKSIANYQVVILGRDAEVYLTDDALVQLKRWLRDAGGSLVCFRGPPTTQVNERLAQLLPVRWDPSRESRFHVKLTERGRELRWIPADDATAGGDPLAKLPTLAVRAQPVDSQPSPETWAVGEAAGSGDFPVVSSRPYGVSGRVVVVEGAGMWRWALLAPKYEAHEATYSALWHSLVRWLVSNPGLLPTQTWKLTSDKIRFTTGEAATATLQVREAALKAGPPAIELRKRGSDDVLAAARPTAVGEEPGAFRVALGQLAEGRYEARIAGSKPDDSAARMLFDVQRNLDEMLKLDANPNLMKRIATTSGGAALESADPDELARQLADQLARSRPEQIRTTTAWDRWWVLAGVLGLWACTWGLRRSSGLV